MRDRREKVLIEEDEKEVRVFWKDAVLRTRKTDDYEVVSQEEFEDLIMEKVLKFLGKLVKDGVTEPLEPKTIILMCLDFYTEKRPALNPIIGLRNFLDFLRDFDAVLANSPIYLCILAECGVGNYDSLEKRVVEVSKIFENVEFDV